MLGTSMLATSALRGALPRKCVHRVTEGRMTSVLLDVVSATIEGLARDKADLEACGLSQAILWLGISLPQLVGIGLSQVSL